METVTLKTALPEYYNDLCDVVRLFLGECEITENEGGHYVIVHEMKEKHTVTCGERIAQLAVMPVAPASFAEAAVLEDSDRGEGGFGSTGTR